MGKINERDIRKICEYIEINHVYIFRKWEEVFGDIWFKGDAENRYTVGGDDKPRKK